MSTNKMDGYNVVVKAVGSLPTEQGLTADTMMIMNEICNIS